MVHLVSDYNKCDCWTIAAERLTRSWGWSVRVGHVLSVAWCTILIYRQICKYLLCGDILVYWKTERETNCPTGHAWPNSFFTYPVHTLSLPSSSLHFPLPLSLPLSFPPSPHQTGWSSWGMVLLHVCCWDWPAEGSKWLAQPIALSLYHIWAGICELGWNKMASVTMPITRQHTFVDLTDRWAHGTFI